MICLRCRRACLCKRLPKPPRVTGPQLRAFRAAIGWTQGQLAHAVGVTRVTVARWEAASSRPEAQTLLRLHLVAAAQGAKLAQP